jgi:hypothetical protein
MKTDGQTTELRSPLIMVHGAPDADHWALIVGDVGRALDLKPAVEVFSTGPGRSHVVDELLVRASAMRGPVLVLPAGTPTRHRAPSRAAPRDVPGHVGHAATAPGVRSVLIPSDATVAVAAGAGILRDRLGTAGVRATFLHVVTDDNRPRMWEGPGHHAAEWFNELCRRHRTQRDALTVVSGRADDQVRAYATSADLVVMLWNREAATGRASVLRSVLVAGIEVPHLLVPLAWIGASRRFASYHVLSGHAKDR